MYDVFISSNNFIGVTLTYFDVRYTPSIFEYIGVNYAQRIKLTQQGSKT